MKFYVAILCVCLVQLGSGSESAFEKRSKQRIQNEVFGASEKFIDDFIFILKTLKGHSGAQESMSDLFISILSRRIPKEQNAKIDVKSARDYLTRNSTNSNNGWTTAKSLDTLKLVESFLSVNIPPERLNNMVNLLFTLEYPNATSGEIESALGYLYGTEATEMKLNLLNIPDATAADCPDEFQRHSQSIHKLNEMIDIKSKVIEDATAIRDKFPCIDMAVLLLERFVFILDKFECDRFKMDASTITLDNNLEFLSHAGSFRKLGFKEVDFEFIESILSTRLPAETFSGIVNFIKATEISDSVEQNQKAADYLYTDDVPQKNDAHN